jgi:molybdate transport system substrate-binding protein
MAVSRRHLIAAAPAILLGATAAQANTTDIAVSCDTAVAPAIIAAARAYRARSGVRVRVLPTEPGLLLPQLERDIQNEIIVTGIATIDQAEKRGIVKPGSRIGPWRNRLVMAAAKQPGGPTGSVAVPDPSPATEIDGEAILKAIDAKPASVIGVIDTAAVAWTLNNGGARQGLLHQTEVAADERLTAVAPIPDAAWPPILYGATVTTLAWRGNPVAFIAFLASPDGIAILKTAGLEVPA